ncbi:MAG: PD-(D/E)XK nuclease family protein, partial [Muribaculaceae bacterium]|nr:PD-(D/E)XK nuclease family protein [Muribaculaceae bacterium]
LTLGSSRSVECVIDCLRMIQKGVEGELRSEISDGKNELSTHDVPVAESGLKKKQRLNWVDIAPQFRSYCLQQKNTEVSLQERIERFLSLAQVEDESELTEAEQEELSRFREDPMDAMLSDMYAVTLPSLVEAIAERFVPEELLRKESIYLAALQDAVIDYCKIYPADIASMLKWWDTFGKNTTIVSPEGTNAITVMSIHKSKGLEFECVLLPDFNIPLRLKKEWTWVDVPVSFPMAEDLPARMPICLYEEAKNSNEWSNSPFALIQSEARYYNMADQVNKAYVAMTRPVSELYIFLKGVKSDFDDVSSSLAEKDSGFESPGSGHTKSYKSIASSIKTLMRDAEDELEACPEVDRQFLLDTELLDSDVSADDNGEMDVITYSYGVREERVGIEAGSLCKRRLKKLSAAEERPIERYFVNSDRALLRYNPEGKRLYADEADDDRIDPREEGTKLHAVLERVKVASDLDRSFEIMRIRGVLSRDEIARYKPLLTEALQRVADRGWFDGSQRVLNERALLKRGMRMRRPDRVLVDKDGNLTVIDYKFKFVKGAGRNSAHHRQVRQYMKYLKEVTGARQVEGFLWYINDDFRIERVEE